MKMQNNVHLLRFLIEIRHHNDEVTIGFVFTEQAQDIPAMMEQAHYFFPIELLNGETIYLAKKDIKAFKIVDVVKDIHHNIWSFDPYLVLGITSDISEADLHKHYIELLKTVHPDVIDIHHLNPAFKVLATDMTRRIMSAFEFVRSEISLKKYQQGDAL